jgi:hypothetical protein
MWLTKLDENSSESQIEKSNILIPSSSFNFNNFFNIFFVAQRRHIGVERVAVKYCKQVHSISTRYSRILHESKQYVVYCKY